MCTADKDNNEIYIDRWSRNAQNHFAAGDYDWLCDFIREMHETSSIKTVLEIGCGAGRSTLAFTKAGFRVIAVDINEYAITETEKFIENNGYATRNVTPANPLCAITDNVSLLKMDIITDLQELVCILKNQPIDLIVLCNPGGQYDPVVTDTEYRLLRQYGWSVEEILEKANPKLYPLLHKWAFIYSSFELSQLLDKEIVIVERGAKKEVEDMIDQLAKDMGVRGIKTGYRKIDNAPTDGIQYGNIFQDDLYWGATLFYPR